MTAATTQVVAVVAAPVAELVAANAWVLLWLLHLTVLLAAAAVETDMLLTLTNKCIYLHQQ